jgi:hypothetical protein
MSFASGRMSHVNRTSSIEAIESVISSNVLQPKINAELEAELAEIDKLNFCNEALELLADPDLSSEERAELIEELQRIEHSLEVDDVLHQL